MRPSEIRALACDYDRTLTTPDLRPAPRAMRALARAREAGLRVVVVSGRDLEFLHRELGEVVDVFVGENGCLLLEPGAQARPLGAHAGDLRAALACLNVPLEWGQVLASADVAHEPLIREALKLAGMEADLVRNRDRVMVLPKGIDKAAGVLAALKFLGVDPRRCAAAGDGENDVPMLREVGYAIAVQNAVPELKEVADHVTERYGGDGVADWIETRWLPARGATA